MYWRTGHARFGSGSTCKGIPLDLSNRRLCNRLTCVFESDLLPNKLQLPRNTRGPKGKIRNSSMRVRNPWCWLVQST